VGWRNTPVPDGIQFSSSCFVAGEDNSEALRERLAGLSDILRHGQNPDLDALRFVPESAGGFSPIDAATRHRAGGERRCVGHDDGRARDFFGNQQYDYGEVRDGVWVFLFDSTDASTALSFWARSDLVVKIVAVDAGRATKRLNAARSWMVDENLHSLRLRLH
jgi:hypothetical protein